MKRIFLSFSAVLALTFAGCAADLGGPVDVPPSSDEVDLDMQGDLDPEPADETPREPEEPKGEGAKEPEPDTGTGTDEDDGRPGDEPADPGSDPVVNATCGDGVAEGEELCDGADLAGLNCRSAGFASGSVTCGASCDAVRTQSCSPLSATPIAQPGGSLPIAGALEPQDPVWQRPNADCSEGWNAGQHFDGYAIVNNTGAQQQIRIAGAWGENDGFLHVFSYPWNPITAHGCLVGNDDADGTENSEIPELTIAPGQTLVVAVSSYGPDAQFPYNLVIDTIDPQNPPVTDPGTQPEPEPGAQAECGNGIIEEGEACDGASLGGATCGSLGYDFGFLVCGGGCQLGVSFCFGLGEEPEPPAEDPPPVSGPVTPVKEPGLTLSLGGVLDDSDAQWTRPTESCSMGSTQGQRFDEHRIVNNSGSTRYLDLQANWEGDGFLAVYTAGFDASAPTTGCLDADDDFTAGAAAARMGSRIEDFAIYPGEELVVVATTFGSDAKIGYYTVDITSQADSSGEPIASLASPGGSITTSGTLHGTDATWNRLGSTCSSSPASGDYPRDRLLVKNETGSSQELDIDAAWYEGDGYLHVFVYDDSAGAMGNGLCLDANDDAGGSGASAISGLLTYSGETLLVVASSFSADAAIGAYDITVATR